MDSVVMHGRIAWLCLLVLVAPAFASKAEMISVDEQAAGSPPLGFVSALTGGGGPVKWEVQKAPGDSPGKIIAQTSAEAVDDRYPLLVYDAVSTENVDLSVKFQTMSGAIDQAAGLIWRYQDSGNYYLVRANALESNVILYKVKDGVRTPLPFRGGSSDQAAKVAVLKDAWNVLAVEVRGAVFSVTYNGDDLFEVEDTTFAKAGKTGLWTKADSVTVFEDFSVTATP